MAPLAAVDIFDQQVPPAGWSSEVDTGEDLRGMHFTLVFLLDDNRVLLGRKKRGLGINLWNGFGGKLEDNETLKQGAAREVWEECQLHICPADLISIGRLIIVRPGPKAGEAVHAMIHIFTCRSWEGRLAETEEMEPKWYSRTASEGDLAIPFDKMWPEARIYLPPLLLCELQRRSATMVGKVEYNDGDTLAGWQFGWRS